MILYLLLLLCVVQLTDADIKSCDPAHCTVKDCLDICSIASINFPASLGGGEGHFCFNCQIKLTVPPINSRTKRALYEKIMAKQRQKNLVK